MQKPELIRKLRQAATECTKKKADASNALWFEENTEKYKALLLERARIIAGLRSIIESVLDPKDKIFLEIASISTQAERAIREFETGNKFTGTGMMGVLLIERGSRNDDPDQLESLITELEQE